MEAEDLVEAVLGRAAAGKSDVVARLRVEEVPRDLPLRVRWVIIGARAVRGRWTIEEVGEVETRRARARIREIGKALFAKVELAGRAVRILVIHLARSLTLARVPRSAAVAALLVTTLGAVPALGAPPASALPPTLDFVVSGYVARLEAAVAGACIAAPPRRRPVAPGLLGTSVVPGCIAYARWIGDAQRWFVAQSIVEGFRPKFANAKTLGLETNCTAFSAISGEDQRFRVCLIAVDPLLEK